MKFSPYTIVIVIWLANVISSLYRSHRPPPYNIQGETGDPGSGGPIGPPGVPGQQGMPGKMVRRPLLYC